jgi:MFS family permease
MLITEPVVLFFGLWSAFCVGAAFMFTQSITQVYSALYSWSFFGTGLVQSAIIVGELIGLLASIYQDKLYFDSTSKNTENPGHPIPEARLYLSIPGSFLGLTVGLFFYAWTSYSTLHWILPTIGLGFVGFGMFCVVTAVTGYIMDAYSKYAASAIAGVAFLENCFAAFLPLATQSMYKNLGFQWSSSLLGFLGLALSFIPLVLQSYGRGIRERSPFMRQAGHALS